MGCSPSSTSNTSVVPANGSAAHKPTAVTPSEDGATVLVSVDAFRLTVPMINDLDLLLEHIASDWQYCTNIEDPISHDDLVRLAKQCTQPVFEKIEAETKLKHPELVSEPKKLEKATDAEIKNQFNKQSRKQVIDLVVEAMKEAITYLRNLIWEQRKLDEKEAAQKAAQEAAEAQLITPEAAAVTEQ